MLEGLISGLFKIFTSNMMNIPLIEPLVDYLMQIPLVNLLVALILWRPFFAVIILPGLVGLLIYLLWIVYWERKLTARVQWRVGPIEVARPIRGAIQALADGIRYFFQEAIIHREAHKIYYIQLPILAFIPILLPLLFIPAGNVVGIKTPYGIQLIVAFIALIPLFIVAMGWASHSRFAYIGSLREAFMYFAYEIPFIIAVVAMIYVYGSGDPYVAVEKQNIPGAVLNPLAFIVYIIAMIMATSRLPFEIPEADQEIAFGPFVEYSGILFGLVMTLLYEKLYLMALLFVILFLGGWEGFYVGILGDFCAPLVLFIKTVVVISVLVIVRSVYARYRLDQAIRLGWTSYLTLSIAALILGMFVGVLV
ncbi:MAG: NADH-quinone oxidoreductase subunit NuoH [Archaeoglobaceae archaeon]|nr:NADH-quinone oxidoreductase subunit NuoH [Archaeoglobaceae archaeon]MCX8151935.1 NADH-quinone oxidoreductase subunit NuoH [Archaeoglobaceae archaeon]MDW8013324.1 NADH-quinone oxidoreductase subunit NuoH [Archaeoglobaceae archaeon]